MLRPGFWRDLAQEFRTITCIRAVCMGALSGSAGAFVRYLDKGYEMEFLNEVVPDEIVFNGLIVFAAVVASFRTAHALARYKAAASYLQKMQAGWYDAASTLFAFTRTSKSPPADILQFQVVIVRLLSLMNALCLERLVIISGDAGTVEFAGKLNIIAPESFHREFLESIDQSDAKPELVMASMDHLLVNAMRTGVLNTPPPMLTRSFAELSNGYEVYVEARKMAAIPFPFAYILFGYVVLLAIFCSTPMMLAHYCKGVTSTFLFTFAANFLLWYINGVADVLNNPYSRKARLLNAQASQDALNHQLCQLLENKEISVPSVTDVDNLKLSSLRASAGSGRGNCTLPRRSLGSWKTSLTKPK